MTSHIDSLPRQHKRWFEYFTDRPEAQATLFCFPFVGGNERNYLNWPEHIDTQFDVAGLKLPGRPCRSREAFPDHISELVEPIVAQLAKYPRPFALFGHSMGGLLVFLVTAELNRLGIQTLGSFISARPAPQLAVLKRRAHLPKPALIEELRILGGTPEEVLQDEGMMDAALPAVRADYHLLENYQYQNEAALITQPIDLIAARHDKLISEAQVEAWQKLPLPKINRFDIDGGHFYLNEYPETLFDFLNNTLDLELQALSLLAHAS
ncbi:thioesterase II family protein [Pseudoalteromonas sp. T1lg65]|uniref:thioesterase II family protein n=1 Tax=Pseudoalteromonas sp. T1lg65 TaxID=2077101 RepID=UPI003F7A0F03